MERLPRPIASQQNSEYSQRLLAAQARRYADAKRIQEVRVATVLLIAFVSMTSALSFPELRPAVGGAGGALALAWSVTSSRREKRCIHEAVMMQEEFDTHVFGLPWNGILADHPTPTAIAAAAARYRGNRTKDWYPDMRNVPRPMDVLICQRTNLGWSTSTHRWYAVWTGIALVALIAVGMAIAFGARLSLPDMLIAVAIPFLGPINELVEIIRANRESVTLKVGADAKASESWQRGLSNTADVTLADCRSLQDLILSIRQKNAHIPDWFDNLHRDHSQRTMQASADHMITEVTGEV
ncbi:S-4TM family putative pore-forming effector [Glycomyces sp. NRRL B-16210]|uniref:S-4TM family putative pore-forming effector n=1 Tax=Glycomyces sp. NRRL B-16210 TaxID=1463821 RepID=UPI0004C11EAA|nr:S-4TM family putative pore-forming effector [Glycomyces sp. NRRL B-16210]